MYSMTTLTPRRSAILNFIRERIAQQGQPPSLAEIAEAFGLPRAVWRANTCWR